MLIYREYSLNNENILLQLCSVMIAHFSPSLDSSSDPESEPLPSISPDPVSPSSPDDSSSLDSSPDSCFDFLADFLAGAAFLELEQPSWQLESSYHRLQIRFQ